MKHLLTTAITLAVGACLPAFGTGNIDLQGTVFTSDTIAHYYIGPGATHTHLHLSSAGRNIEVFALTLDRGDATYNASAQPKVIIGKDMAPQAESVSSMAARHTTAGEQILAGINGDFFITGSFAAQHEFGNQILGYPNMTCVIDGKLAAPDMIDITSRENALIIGGDNMWIDATDMSYTVEVADGATLHPLAMNYPRRDNEIMLYNSYMGVRTDTSSGLEIALAPAVEGQEWKLNAPMDFVVVSVVDGGHQAIPEEGVVLSVGPSASREGVEELAIGSRVSVTVGLTLPAFDGIAPDIKDVIGGDVRILNQGTVTTSAIRWINTPSAKYPRSLVGYSADRKKLVMAAVDGGSTLSSGVSYYEAADLMAALGCHDALDLDGGGSTAMWSAHAGILNRPRDGAERAVGNALYISLAAPADAEVASIRFADHARTMPVFGKYCPVVYGYNKYGQLVDTDVQGVAFSIEEEVADIHGGEVIVLNAGRFVLHGAKDGMSAEMPLTVLEGEAVEAERSNLLIDLNISAMPRLRSKVGDKYMEVSPAAFAWSSNDESVATVDEATGEIHGVSDGRATVTGTRGDISIALSVRVEVADAQLMAFDDFCGEGWKVTKTGLSNFTQEGAAFSFDVSNSRNAAMTIAKNLEAYSCPEAFSMNIGTGGASLSAVTLKLRADNASTPVNIKAEDVNGGVLKIDLDEHFDLADAYVYPLHFISVKLEPGNGADGGKHFDIGLSDVGFSYSNYNGGIRDVAVGDDEIRFKPVVVDGEVTVPGADSVELYDITGRRIPMLPAAGIAIVRARFGSRVVSGKVAQKL